MYEKGSTIKVAVGLGNVEPGELECVGEVLIDTADFMAVRPDTLVIPKAAIKSAEQLPDKPLEEQLGTTASQESKLSRPEPPKVENVRFLPQSPRQTPGT